MRLHLASARLEISVSFVVCVKCEPDRVDNPRDVHSGFCVTSVCCGISRGKFSTSRPRALPEIVVHEDTLRRTTPPAALFFPRGHQPPGQWGLPSTAPPDTLYPQQQLGSKDCPTGGCSGGPCYRQQWAAGVTGYPACYAPSAAWGRTTRTGTCETQSYWLMCSARIASSNAPKAILVGNSSAYAMGYKLPA